MWGVLIRCKAGHCTFAKRSSALSKRSFTIRLLFLKQFRLIRVPSASARGIILRLQSHRILELLRCTQKHLDLVIFQFKRVASTEREAEMRDQITSKIISWDNFPPSTHAPRIFN